MLAKIFFSLHSVWILLHQWKKVIPWRRWFLRFEWLKRFLALNMVLLVEQSSFLTDAIVLFSSRAEVSFWSYVLFCVFVYFCRTFYYFHLFLFFQFRIQPSCDALVVVLSKICLFCIFKPLPFRLPGDQRSGSSGMSSFQIRLFLSRWLFSTTDGPWLPSLIFHILLRTLHF